MDSTKKIYIFLIVVTIVIVLIYAQSIIIPFILALIFWYIIRVIKKLVSKIKFIRPWPDWILSILSTVLLFSLLLLILEMITNNIQQLTDKIPDYQSNVNVITNAFNDRFNIDLGNKLNEMISNLKFIPLLTKLFSALTGLLGGAFTVLLYLIFLLLEEPLFPKKMKNMYPEKDKYEKANKLIRKIDHSVESYIALKTLVSLLTGILSFIALYFIGIDAPVFWAFLIFMLNFIPTIGSLIATSFPAIFALLQFGEFTPGILVLIIVGVIQLVIGNFVEPRVMGNSLNISPLVVFLTLAIWGLIWGITGMLLSVPITVILIIVMSEFPSTQPLAILLSQKGIIDKKKNEK